VRDRSFNPTPPDDTVLPREAQPYYQDHAPPPPPQPEYGGSLQPAALDPDILFNEFVEFPGSPQFQNPPFLPPQPPPEAHVQPYSCESCHKTFPQAHEFNRHMKRHDRRYKCPIADCPSSGFPSRQDCERHLEAKHPESVQDQQLHYCPVQTCKYATKGMTRADNFQRHMKQHPGVMW